MSKSKKKSLIFVVLVTLVSFIGGLFLAYKGVIQKEVMGLRLLKWVEIIIAISLTVVILYDFISIRVKRKKYGVLKYRLKRKDKSKHIIGMILIVIIFSIQLAIFTEGFKKFNSHVIFIIYFIISVPLMFIYHNIEKEGLGEGGVFHWGDVIKWEKVVRYSFRGDTLTVIARKKSFGVDEMFEIPFYIQEREMIEIEEFLSEQIGN